MYSGGTIKVQGRILQSGNRGKETWCRRDMEEMLTNNEIDRNEGQECILESRVRIKQAGGHRTIGTEERRLCTPWAKQAETEYSAGGR